MKIKIVICAIFDLSVVLSTFGQLHKQVFEYLAKTQTPNETDHFRFYYIVDSSNAFKLKQLTFYAFTFSTDSTEKTGYIAYDRHNGDLVFISDTLNRSKTIIHRLFSLKTTATTKTGFISNLGDELKRTVKNDMIILTTRLTGPIKNHDSHSIYLQRLEFKKENIYPSSLSFFFPFDEEGTIKLKPKYN